VAEYLTLRRYYLNKRSAAVLRQDDIASLWQGKQAAEPGTVLPDEFPSKAALATAGYTTKEDLDGADADELVKYASLARKDANKVMAALAVL